MKKIIFLTGLISLSVMSFGQRANKGTIIVNNIELDPIYTTDSPNLLWWIDTIPTIATKYNLTFYEPKISEGTTLEFLRGDKTWQTLNTSKIWEAYPNYYFTDSRAREAISLTTNGTSGVSTYDNYTGIVNIPNYSSSTYTLPLATNVERGGIKIGYSGTDNNFPLQLYFEKGYVSLPDASTATKGLSKFSSNHFNTSFGFVTIKDAGITADNLTNGSITPYKLSTYNAPTDGYSLSYSSYYDAFAWNLITGLPSQVSQSGKYLTTNGTSASWANHYSGWMQNGDFIDMIDPTDQVRIGSVTATGTFDLYVAGQIHTGGLLTLGIINATDYIMTDEYLLADYLLTGKLASAPSVISTEAGWYAKTDNKAYFKANSVEFDLTNVVEPFRSIAANTTLATTDKIVLVTTGGITITYPTVPAGKVYTIKNSASTAITVPSYRLLSSSNSTSVAGYGCITVVYSGSLWYQLD